MASIVGQTGVVILAAGASSRMQQPKLLLPWGKVTVLESVIAQWCSLTVGQIAVVYSPEDLALVQVLNSLKHCSRIPNPDRASGMFGSIRCASLWQGWHPGLTHFVIALGDQPLIQSQTLKVLLDWASERPDQICLPRYDGHRRHPFVLPRKWFLELRMTAQPTMRAFLSHYPERQSIQDLDDIGLALDLDYPQDYQRALALAFCSKGKR